MPNALTRALSPGTGPLYALVLAARRLTGARRAAPSFVIIGAQRAGTSSLYRYLTAHPGVKRALRKEVHYFDLSYERGPGWYRAHFPATATGQITGEATPYYLTHERTPGRLAKDLPDAKLIVLLRDPVKRAYSHYEYQRRRGRETLSFEDALDAEQQRLESDDARRFSYVTRGQYADALERWFAVRPRDAFLILASEDLFRDTPATYTRVLDFLGLPQYELGDYPRLGRGDYSPMNAETEARLAAHFRPHNTRLRELLSEEFAWMR